MKKNLNKNEDKREKANEWKNREIKKKASVEWNLWMNQQKRSMKSNWPMFWTFWPNSHGDKYGRDNKKNDFAFSLYGHRKYPLIFTKQLLQPFWQWEQVFCHCLFASTEKAFLFYDSAVWWDLTFASLGCFSK